MCPRLPPRFLLCLAFGLVLLRGRAAPEETQTLNITVPKGSSNHGDPHLLCYPTKWTDIVVFFLGNYVSHSATVKAAPGEPSGSVFLLLLGSLLFPSTGIMRGLENIWSRAVFGKGAVEQALRSGALCMIVRSGDWKPETGDRVRNIKVEKVEAKKGSPSGVRQGDDGRVSVAEREERDIGLEPPASDSIHLLEIPKPSQDNEQPSAPALQVSPTYFTPQFLPPASAFGITGRRVHGICSLPAGYELQIVPKNAIIHPVAAQQVLGAQTSTTEVAEQAPVQIASSYGFVKGLVAILQTIFASATLYRTRGDQLKRYGYAAFGLTVTPYLVMSVVNLTSILLTPDYPSVYLVHSETMDEASRRSGAQFSGLVGSMRIDENPAADEDSLDAAFEVGEDGRTTLRFTRLPDDLLNRWADVLGRVEDTVEVLIDGSVSAHAHKLVVPSTHKHNAKGSSLDSMSEYDQDTRLGYYSIASWLVSLCSIVIIGVISKFKAGSSTTAQRVWTMTWLSLGILVGPSVYSGWRSLAKSLSDTVIFVFVLAPPAIGGFVTVALMLQDYGRCIRIY
ncbi:MAG: hypothetical protein M1839_003764 [Geoglossum umbratile]|nr:MAG: hypothetical protein M1839_003764 [Geoglossum umbratile]